MENLIVILIMLVIVFIAWSIFLAMIRAIGRAFRDE